MSCSCVEFFVIAGLIYLGGKVLLLGLAAAAGGSRSGGRRR